MKCGHYVVQSALSDADKDDTGRYKIEITNASGTGVCEVPVKVKG